MSFRPSKRVRSAISFVGSKRLTEQHHKHKCCIHRIAADALRGLPVDHLSKVAASFDDFSTAPVDFQDAMNRLAEAQQTFDSLPAHLRQLTGNRVESFVNFVSDPKNLPTLLEHGLATRRPSPPPPITVKVEPSTLPATPAAPSKD